MGGIDDIICTLYLTVSLNRVEVFFQPTHILTIILTYSYLNIIGLSPAQTIN